MKMAGVDDRTLMDLGGWTDIAMLRRYAHFSTEYKLKAAQLVNGTAGVMSRDEKEKGGIAPALPTTLAS